MLKGETLSRHTSKLYDASQLRAALEKNRERIAAFMDPKKNSNRKVVLHFDYQETAYTFNQGAVEFGALVALAQAANERDIVECEALIKKLGQAIHNGEPIENL